MQYEIRTVTSNDIEHCYEIESAAYSIDEAATKEKIQIRAEQYPEGFIVLEVDSQIIGFINSGCADQVIMSNDDFKALKGHLPLGKNLVIMSVVVMPKFQGKGYSSKLINEFIRRAKIMQKEAIYLMCKEQYLKFYEKFGFEFIKESDSSHGGMKWFEMKLKLI
ncbi:GNAT family N-acetyltransferase [Acinetobacter qingfengensis]|uniref:GNAT family N-acetyltransferase n=1 Tax=Acinetobacter qingfengensis TaxID=1262585 RepID=A0A1E7R7M7_9GAMM|nr:GNAT family N-acetyltransferase [Acinetobacter qingfengensis]KAA8731454.1 GNAT family N-acetyltransferase [Acinetobacter qingfengensis]OEY95318.1 GNAT family N-acetyltransferase [Acinetobacter qingfengensis]